MQKIIYADLHCDSITKCCACGGDMLDFSGQVNIRKLTASGCGAQCFALFTDGENAEEDFKKFLAFYGAQIEKHPRLQPVLRRGDVERAVESGKIGAVLTVENLGFLNGGVSGIAALKTVGVKMASLVWNSANAYAYPNLKFKDGAPDIAARESRGLTTAGRAAVEELNKNGVICDISHLSDGGAEDVFAISELPVVASHSNCAAVCNVSRNLTDGQIKKIAESGGLVGLNFCRDFVVEGAFADGLYGTAHTKNVSVFEGLYGHFIHLVNVGGEDIAAIGSDFDGIPPYGELSDCTKLSALFEYFERRGVNERLLEKFAFGNFLRLFG